MRKFLKNQKGVTMIEVLVTIAILAIVVVPCLSSFVMAQRGNVKAAETERVYTAAANFMEELKGDASLLSEASGKLQDDGKVVTAFYVATTYDTDKTYYTVAIYAGEHEQEPDQNSGIEPIIKGVIAP